MITRLDDDLHAKLKARALAEGRSLNDFVTHTLATAVGRPATRQEIRERARALGILATPPRPKRRAIRNETLAASVGSGDSVSKALEDERATG